MNESYHTYGRVMSHTWMSHVTHMTESCHIIPWKRHVTHMNESFYIFQWVMSHVWIRHVTCIWSSHVMTFVVGGTAINHEWGKGLALGGDTLAVNRRLFIAINVAYSAFHPPRQGTATMSPPQCRLFECRLFTAINHSYSLPSTTGSECRLFTAINHKWRLFVVSHDSFTRVTWLIHMCDMTHSYVWHDSFMCVIGLEHTCDVTYSYVRHASLIRVTRRYVSIICVTWRVHMCDMTHSHV